MVKGKQNNYKSIERTILDMHSYSVPGIAVIPVVDGHAPYLEWMAAGSGS